MRRLPSLNALLAFDSVARLGSVSLAGGELNVTPGAVSRRVKELEADLGVALLVREGRGVRLTAAGKRLEKGLQPGFESIIKAVLRTRRDPKRKQLLVAVVPVFASSWLIPHLDNFSSQHANVDIVIVDRIAEPDTALSSSEAIIDWGDFSDIEEFKAERLTDEEIVPICAPGVCADGDLSQATLLHRHTFPTHYNLTMPNRLPEWAGFMAAIGRDDVDTRNGPRFSSGLIMNAALAGRGVALSNSTMAKSYIAEGTLVRPIPESMKTNNGYWLLTPGFATELPEVQAFISWLREELDRDGIAARSDR